MACIGASRATKMLLHGGRGGYLIETVCSLEQCEVSSQDAPGVFLSHHKRLPDLIALSSVIDPWLQMVAICLHTDVMTL